MDVTERARRYISTLPKAVAGQGGHDATFRCACVLVHGFDLGEAAALSLLSEWNGTHCDPQWSQKELEHKVRSAASSASEKPKGYLLKGQTSGGGGSSGVAPMPQKKDEWIPDFDEEKLAEFVAGVPAVDENWFMERSPVDPRQVTPGEFLEHSFARGERVLIFTDYRSQGDYLWEVGRGGFRLSDQRGVKAVKSKLPEGGPDGVWFLSQPVDGQWHVNPRQEGRYSRRSLESVSRWVHLVLESDVAPEALWLKYLARFPLEIRAIYSSGGKSWHALVVLERDSKAAFDGILRSHVKRILPIFGGDARAMTPVRLTRLPGCMRGKKLQKLIYLNSNPVGEIIDLPKRREIASE